MARGHSYVVALGSNMRVPGIGGPRQVLRAAIAMLADREMDIRAVSRIVDSAPVGPSLRRYANAAAVLQADYEPPHMLEVLHSVEHALGRRRMGEAWRARTLDLDLVLWSGGVWDSRHLVIPHPRFRERGFVLRPAAEVAPFWRVPLTGLTLRQLAARAS